MTEKLAGCPFCGTTWKLVGDNIAGLTIEDYASGACLVCEGYWIDFLENDKKLERVHVEHWNLRRPAPSREASREALMAFAAWHAGKVIAEDDDDPTDYDLRETVAPGVDDYLKERREHPAQPEPIPLTAEDEARLDSLATETPEAWDAALKRGAQSETMPEPVKAWRDAVSHLIHIGKELDNEDAAMYQWIRTHWPESEGR